MTDDPIGDAASMLIEARRSLRTVGALDRLLTAHFDGLGEVSVTISAS